MTKDEHIAALIAADVRIDEIISAYGGYHAEGLQAYVEAVPYDDELEQAGDKYGMVSPGCDPGAWVLAWVWVRNEDAGIEADDEDEED
jgi:hypothetical protein